MIQLVGWRAYRCGWISSGLSSSGKVWLLRCWHVSIFEKVAFFTKDIIPKIVNTNLNNQYWPPTDHWLMSSLPKKKRLGHYLRCFASEVLVCLYALTNWNAWSPSEITTKPELLLIVTCLGQLQGSSMLVGKVVRKKPATNDKVISFHASHTSARHLIHWTVLAQKLVHHMKNWHHESNKWVAQQKVKPPTVCTVSTKPPKPSM